MLSDHQKIVWFISLLTGKAFRWAMVVWEQGREPLSSYNCFVELFQWVCDHTSEDKEIGDQLLSVIQAEYA